MHDAITIFFDDMSMSEQKRFETEVKFVTLEWRKESMPADG